MRYSLYPPCGLRTDIVTHGRSEQDCVNTRYAWRCHPQGLDDTLQVQTEKSLNNVPHCEVLYGSGHTHRVLDPLVRRNLHWEIPLVGGKNASLGEMYRELASQGVKVPNGFAISADAYREFLWGTKLDRTIEEILLGLIGICGQAPSDYPDFAKFLVEQGIDSISLNPDTVLKTTVAVLEMENVLRR